MFARKFSTINRFVSLLWLSWKEVGSRYIVCTVDNCKILPFVKQKKKKQTPTRSQKQRLRRKGRILFFFQHIIFFQFFSMHASPPPSSQRCCLFSLNYFVMRANNVSTIVFPNGIILRQALVLHLEPFINYLFVLYRRKSMTDRCVFQWKLLSC